MIASILHAGSAAGVLGRYVNIPVKVMNILTFPILHMLADGRFHSGEAMAAHFKVTRSTIWNALQDAEALGVQIFSVPGRGYKLPQPLVLLDKAEVLSAIGEQRAWFNLEIHDQLESTNTYLMKQASSNASAGYSAAAAHATCVVAELQTRGRGRRGRSWQAALGASLTFSLLWRFQCGASALSGLSLAVGVAMIRALRETGLAEARLKWPNDVVVAVNGQAGAYHKLAGILIELQGDMEGPSAAVIGIGVNLKLPEQVRRHIDQPVTDMATLMQKTINPNTLLGVLLKHLAVVLSEFERNGFDNLRAEWLQYHAYQNEPVRLIMPDGRELQGMACGVAADGVLLVKTPQGEQRFSSGEISLRGATGND